MLDDEWSRKRIADWDALPDNAPSPLVDLHGDVTEPAKIYKQSSTRAMAVIVHIVQTSVFSDNAVHVAKEALQGSSAIPKAFDPSTPIAGSKRVFFNRYFELHGVLLEMVLAKMCEAVTTYTTSIIQQCLLARPEILKSKETLTFETAIGFADVLEMRSHLIGRKINELAYEGFEGLNKYIADRLGITSHTSSLGFQILNEGIEVRNCLVHNSGRFGEKYERKFGKHYGHKVGDKIEINMDHPAIIAQAGSNYVSALDEALATKFSLSRAPL